MSTLMEVFMLSRHSINLVAFTEKILNGKLHFYMKKNYQLVLTQIRFD